MNALLFCNEQLKKIHYTVKEFPIVKDPAVYLIVGPSFNGQLIGLKLENITLKLD
jgi:hypothetical protein